MAQEHTRTTESKKTRIPAFHSVEEEAIFWDSHDSAEFEDEFTEITDAQFVPAKTIAVHLEEARLRQLTQEARQQGIDPSTLARTWILEQLDRSESAKHE